MISGENTPQAIRSSQPDLDLRIREAQQGALETIVAAVEEQLGTTTLEAVEPLKQAVLLNPTNADGYFNLGWAYVDLKHFKKATRELKEALRLNPNHSGAQERLEMAKRMIRQDSHKSSKGSSSAIRNNRPASRKSNQPVIIITP